MFTTTRPGERDLSAASTSTPLQLLHDLTAIAAAGDSAERLAQASVSHFRSRLGWENGAILLLDPDSNRLEPLALCDRGRGPAFLAQDFAYVRSHPIRVGAGVTGWVAATGRSFRSGDVAGDGRYYGMRSPIRSELCVPICASGRIAGVINIESPRPDAYRNDDQLLLESAANLLAAVLCREGYGTYSDRDSAFDETLRAVAHELRTPLRGIEGLSQALLEENWFVLAEPGRQRARDIVRNAARLHGLIDDILRAGLLDADLPPQPVALEAVIDQALGVLELERRRTRAEVVVERPLGHARGQPAWLVLALVSLLANALKFVPFGTVPRLLVHTQQRSGRTRLWIEDNGIGIAADDQTRIFRPFVRLHPEQAYPGSGLGLALVARAMRRQGGGVGVEPGLRVGSRFWIDLPCGDQGAPR